MMGATATRRRRQLAFVLSIVVGAGVALLVVGKDADPETPFAEPVVEAVDGGPTARPNLVVVMTDDQALSTMESMPNVDKLLADTGTTFANSFVSLSLCCPSRATFFTGQLAHNHGVLGTTLPPEPEQYEAMRKRMASETLPLWLQDAGYVTAHIGKWLHGYGDYDPDDPPPPGWSEWRVPLGFASTYNLTDFALSENGERVDYAGDENYQSDVFTNAATEFIAAQAGGRKPFALSVAYVAPHNGHGGSGRCASSAPPASRHEGTFADAELPDSANMNEEDVSDKPEKVRNLPLLTEETVERTRVRFQCKLESLQAVDEGVREIHDVLAETGVLDNTVLVYTSDNGFMQGEHRFVGSKLFPYDEALRVPLIVSGPGVPRGMTIDHPVLNVDLPATILELAGASGEARTDLDGRSFVPLLRGQDAAPRDLLFEAYLQSDRTDQRVELLFSSIRRGDLMYTEWWTGETELYDFATDPEQLDSLHDDPAYREEREQLAAALADLRDCAGTRDHPVAGRAPCG